MSFTRLCCLSCVTTCIWLLALCKCCHTAYFLLVLCCMRYVCYFLIIFIEVSRVVSWRTACHDTSCSAVYLKSKLYLSLAADLSLTHRGAAEGACKAEAHPTEAEFCQLILSCCTCYSHNVCAAWRLQTGISFTRFCMLPVLSVVMQHSVY